MLYVQVEKAKLRGTYDSLPEASETLKMPDASSLWLTVGLGDWLASFLFPESLSEAPSSNKFLSP
jgi:hypothetical protein